MSPPPSFRPVGRFAPSPTGDLHLGSALAALAAWASARRRGGRFVWRVEDLDGPRAVPGAAGRQIEDARWLGLDWNEGPDVGGPHGPYRQSERGDVYRAALRALAEGGHLFPCRVSRRDLRELASAPHGPDGGTPYPASLRPTDLAPGWFDDPAARADAALRFRVPPGEVSFEDAVAGRVVEDVRRSVGDFVLERRDGVVAYQLAVVVDDLAMGVTEVVRGHDLLHSTARQILLIRALGGRVPAYAHVPLLVAADGEKLSKRDDSLTIRSLRAAGVAAEAVVGWLAATLGQGDVGRRTPAEVAATFEIGRVRPDPVPVPDDLAGRLLAS
ncbi:tRNA glutamyl-Q(34) synthetase GluQRS [Rubrivirga sp.]|uniref:tRNA glutamyl-Q(34) synthetase GluQRS n=1 Tax=Rubrivirga sp. TaxID=1885344 RepID=UPI003B517C1C